jgi:hypothetical protein
MLEVAVLDQTALQILVVLGEAEHHLSFWEKLMVLKQLVVEVLEESNQSLQVILREEMVDQEDPEL